ncbi:MAG: glycoside hydrolase family 30 protein [Prevotella sp.]|jgi:glucosylceramidase
MKTRNLLLAFCLLSGTVSAQTFNVYTTTEQKAWQTSKTSLQSKAQSKAIITVDKSVPGIEFKAWGTCFNELDWDAFNLLTRSQQNELMKNLFDPEGDIRFTRGRLTMNANDYSRAWYSCDDVAGDLDLRYFNIEHDKRNIIPLIRAAQHWQPKLEFWMSPWCPPVWMKINGDYPVLSSKYNDLDPRKDYLLYSGDDNVDPDEMKFLGERAGVFPRKLATKDFFIQDPAYLQAYANMFCRFIDLYAEQNIPIKMVMYQNEAYSYTPYPGCAWTAEGTQRFNSQYLAPTLKRLHPEVKLYLGTFNTNRLDYVEKILSSDTLRQSIEGIGFQWEGRQILPKIRAKYPSFHYICSESECGTGAMDWKAGEHTFFLISDNLGNGCDEYYIWNFLLCDQGESPWGWRQNALVQVNSKTREMRYTAEYYALKHFSHFVSPGTRTLGYGSQELNNGVSAVAFCRPDNKYVVACMNTTDKSRTITVQLGKKYLNAQLRPHSFVTFFQK